MIYIAVVILGIVADRVTKLWAAGSLMHAAGGTVPILPGFLHLTYVENTGAAFGLLQGQQWLFIAVTSLVIAWIVYELIRSRKEMGRLYGTSLSLLLAGALGNWADRILQGYVVDFVDFRGIRFAVFNVADICVTCGVFLLILTLLFFEHKREQKKTDESAAEKAERPVPEENA